MSFSLNQRAAVYAVCGPYGSMVINADSNEIVFGANFLSQIPAVFLDNIAKDCRFDLNRREMQHFIELARQPHPHNDD